MSLHHVEEGLEARDIAGVGPVLVELEGEHRLVAHDLLGVAEQERIGPAVEIGEIDGKQIVAVANSLEGRKNPLAIGPKDIVVTRMDVDRLVRDKVDGYHLITHLGDFPWQLQIDAGITHIVRPANDDDARL